MVTMGIFDGVHVGHQKILQRIKEIGQIIQGETVLITFWPHPRRVLNATSGPSIQLLSTFEEKMTMLAEQGVNHLLKIPFTKAFSQLSATDFIQKILVDKIGVKSVVIGYDHRFGKNRTGHVTLLKQAGKQYGFTVEEVHPQTAGQAVVNTTKIRRLLLIGAVNKAHTYLGRPYKMTGRVVQGNQIGKKIGFPTANLTLPAPYKLIPGNGVYAVNVMHNSIPYKGMLNIGMRPTVGGTALTIEVHILDFEKNIYGESLTIQFIEQLRKEVKFKDLQALQKQLVHDKKAVLNLLSH